METGHLSNKDEIFITAVVKYHHNTLLLSSEVQNINISFVHYGLGYYREVLLVQNIVTHYN